MGAHIAQLAGQLSCRINVHAGKHTQRALKIFWTKQRYSLQATYNEYTDWDNFLPLAIQTREKPFGRLYHCAAGDAFLSKLLCANA